MNRFWQGDRSPNDFDRVKVRVLTDPEAFRASLPEDIRDLDEMEVIALRASELTESK